jgi:hypothetical protein
MSRSHLGRSLSLLVGLAILSPGCRFVDPKAVLEVQDLEGYWVIDKEKSATNYITPAIRFTLKNKSGEPLGNVEATATFKRKGEDSLWGDSFVIIANHSKPLGAGQTTRIEMRSNADYYTPGAPVEPEIMFKHGLFRDATVELFVRVGRSGFVKLAATEVPRRLQPQDAAP